MRREWYWSWSFRKGENGREKQSPSGCMHGFMHLFHLHPLVFTTRRNCVTSVEFLPENSRRRSLEELFKGVEAPRNSLEIDVGTTSSCTSDYDQIPFGIHIVPKNKILDEERSLSSSSSARTTNVVAKLMGLDHIPDSPITPKTNPNHHKQTLFSPSPVGILSYEDRKRRKRRENKTMSSSDESKTPPPRRPLQPILMNLNLGVEDELRRGTRSLPETPRMSLGRRSWDSDPRHSVQSTSGCYYGSKENLYSTNMSESTIRELNSICEDSSLLPLKGRMKEAKETKKVDDNPTERVEHTKDIMSNRIEKGRVKTPQRTTTTTTKTKPSTCSTQQAVKDERIFSQAKTTSSSSSNQWKKARCARYPEKIKKPTSPPISESSPPSQELPLAPPPTLEVPLRKEDRSVLIEYDDYASKVLINVARTQAGRGSPFYPPNRIVFSQFELTSSVSHYDGPLKHRCNRRHLFDLVHESIVNKNTSRMKSSDSIPNEKLRQEVLPRLISPPVGKCEAIEDLDKLVGSDLPEESIRRLLLHPAVKEEVKILTGEVERWILDSLLEDTIATCTC